MSTTTEPLRDEEQPTGEGEDRSTRRLLIVLLTILGLAAVALLVLLLWLLRPESAGPPTAEAGYPIKVVTTIYGYGGDPASLLEYPLGVTFDADGNVWISNTGKGRVEQYTSSGEYIRTVGEEVGTGKLSRPYGLTVDPARDRLYVADLAGRAIQIYSASSGAYVGHFPADDQKLQIFGAEGFSPLDVEIVGGRILAASNDGLYFFDDSGRVVGRWGASEQGRSLAGSALGAFNFPDAIAADPETGRIYVADTLNRRVVALGAAGRWLWTSGKADRNGKIVSFWQLPRGVEVGPDGNVYVVDTFRADANGMGTGHIIVLSPEGDLLSEFGRSGTADGSFRFPEQLEAGPDGLWAIADRSNDRVVVFELVEPYPAVKDIYSDRYPETFVDLAEAIITSTPTPSPAP